MDIAVYKILHILGLILLFQTMGASLFAAGSESESPGGPSRKSRMILHGIGLFLLLLGGFGMLARLEIGFPFPIWTWLKLVVWVVLGAAPVLVKKRLGSAGLWWTLAIILGTLAAYMGLFKPF